MKIGFVASSFDLLHAGHIMMLEEAKMNCDYLLVGFNINPENKNPIQTADERYIQLSAVKYVDEIVEYESEGELLNILKSRSIQIRFLGDDYLNKSYTGEELKIPIHFISRDHGYSTTELKKRIKEAK